jgi:epoxyqueuosine reductase
MNNTIRYDREEKKVPLGAETHNSPGLTASRMRELAREAGFSEAGVAALPYANEERDAERFRAWVGKGRAGTMQYLEQSGEDGRLTRERARIPFPWARSALVCFASYLYPDEPLSSETHERGSAWIARYAWSSHLLPGKKGEKGERRPSDYHKVLLKRLRGVEARLHEEFGEFESRAYVDTGPVVERTLAVAAGLGWTGKNTCLIHPELGSWGFLAVLLTSLDVSEFAGSQVSELAGQRVRELAGSRVRELAGSQVRELAGAQGSTAVEDNRARAVSAFEIPDRCGSCRRCIEACPTNALDVPYQMDATRCVAYLTIEHKGPIAEELMAGMGRQIFGCDICQDVCPWNGKALRSMTSASSPALSASDAERMGRPPIRVDAELEPRPELVNPALEWLASLDERSFEREFNGSPVRRTGFWGLKRNVAIAMGNSGVTHFVSRLEEWANAADEGLRSAARWALGRLRSEK